MLPRRRSPESARNHLLHALGDRGRPDHRNLRRGDPLGIDAALEEVGPEQSAGKPGIAQQELGFGLVLLSEVSEMASEAAMQASTTPRMSHFRSASTRRKSTAVRRPGSLSAIA